MKAPRFRWSGVAVEWVNSSLETRWASGWTWPDLDFSVFEAIAPSGWLAREPLGPWPECWIGDLP